MMEIIKQPLTIIANTKTITIMNIIIIEKIIIRKEIIEMIKRTINSGQVKIRMSSANINPTMKKDKITRDSTTMIQITLGIIRGMKIMGIIVIGQIQNFVSKRTFISPQQLSQML